MNLIFLFFASITNPAQYNLQFIIENFTDTRQSRFESMYDPHISNPCWAPIEGLETNRGLKLDFKDSDSFDKTSRIF